jgi:hypothetical protein
LARSAYGRSGEGAAADIIFVDYQAPTPLTADNLPWHIIFGFESSMVTTTMVNGRLLMQDRKLLTLDEEAHNGPQPRTGGRGPGPGRRRLYAWWLLSKTSLPIT